jgi:tight adherence protein B
MLIVFLVFVLGVGVVLGAYAAITYIPARMARRNLERRLEEVSGPLEVESDETMVVKRPDDGPLQAIDRLVAYTSAGSWLSRVIEQSGVKASPGGLVAASLAVAVAGAFVGQMLTRTWMVAPFAAAVAGVAPIAFVMNRRSARLRRFEEQFPEALDLISRALRAGHAFQTALGLSGEELQDPVGPEFKKTFDQQNFGLPLRDALMQLSERVPSMDVRFFVTAVLIQRETGGNLSEILDNLAHVVRERFKIRRQIRVHTAHGRFTGFVLLALPAFLAAALATINPDHMNTLFRERMGQMMMIGAIVMQTIGFVWIRQVVKIEV